jgi:hypothetical protein
MIEAALSLSMLQGWVGLLNSGRSRVPRGQFGWLTVDRTTRTLKLHLGRQRFWNLNLGISHCLPALQLLCPFAHHA